MRTLWGHLWPYRSQFARGLWWLAAASVLGAVPPLYVGTMIDSLSGREAPMTRGGAAGGPLMRLVVPFYQPNDARTLMLCCLLLVFAVALKSGCVYLSRWALAATSRQFEFQLRRDLLARLVTLGPEFYQRNSVGDLISRVTNDLSALQAMIDSGVAVGVTTMVTMLVALAMMLRLSWTLSLWVIVPVPLIVALTWYFGPLVHRRASAVQSALGLLTARVHENLAAVRVLRAFGQESAEVRALDAASHRFVDANLAFARTRAQLMPALQVSLGLAFLLVLWRGGREVLVNQVSLGTLVAFYAYIGQVVNPIAGLSQLANMFQGGVASMTRLDHVLSAPHRATPSAAPPRRALDGAIEFRHLTFRYPAAGAAGDADRGAALVDISLSIPAGSTCAIVGQTGSGKSTLLALIVGFWESTEGVLLIDDVPAAEWPIEALRRGIGYVPQEPFLFSESVHDNIVCGALDVSSADVIEAATRAALHAAPELRDGYDTRVGERGVALSGGQKQRVALARALARNPRILVLDDPFSSVDSDTERQIVQGLEPSFRSRTTVVASHRLGAVSRADQIVVLDEGHIVERGKHEELLARDGLYAAMYRRQLLEAELQELW